MAGRCTVSPWRKAVEDYVEMRRSLGFKLLDAKMSLIKLALRENS